MTGADGSDARGASAVLDAVLDRYRSVQVVIAESAYDREGLLEWLLGKWEVGLDCVGRLGCGGFVVLLVGGAQFCVVVVLSSFVSVLGCVV